MRSYGAGGDTVEALLALDGHVGAVGSLELDVKGGCVQIISIPSLVSCLFDLPAHANPGRCGRSPC